MKASKSAMTLDSLVRARLQRTIATASIGLAVSGGLVTWLLSQNSDGDDTQGSGGGLFVIAAVALGLLVLSTYFLIRGKRRRVDTLRAFSRFGQPKEMLLQVESELEDARRIQGYLVTPNWIIDPQNVMQGKLLYIPTASDVVATDQVIFVNDGHHRFFIPTSTDAVEELLTFIGVQDRALRIDEDELALHLESVPMVTYDEALLSSKQQEVWINVGCSTLAIVFILWIVIGALLK